MNLTANMVKSKVEHGRLNMTAHIVQDYLRETQANQLILRIEAIAPLNSLLANDIVVLAEFPIVVDSNKSLEEITDILLEAVVENVTSNEDIDFHKTRLGNITTLIKSYC